LKILVLTVVFLSAFAPVIGASDSEVGNQECGYSISTIYVSDSQGKPIENVRISVARPNPQDDYNEHFRQASTIYWDGERQAHVYQHGLCGSHRDLVLKVAAEGFETIEAPVNLPLGFQGFEITLKRQRSQETSNFKMLSCAGSTARCVRTIHPS
jgi:hypothetical protein